MSSKILNSLLKALRLCLSIRPYEPEYAVDTQIPDEMQNPAKNSMKFGVLDRLALIFSHYIEGPLVGINLKVFRPDKHHRTPEILVILSYLGLVGTLLWSADPASPLIWFGLLLLLACPQWLYAFTSIQHTIFEYRGYLFAVGVAAIGAGLVERYAITFPFAIMLLIFFIFKTIDRNRIYSDPLLFWKQAHLDITNDPLVASAYIYQLQKRERFGEVDDLYRWMTAARIPDCRAFLLNLAAAKFGGKSDNAPLDFDKMREALAILQETARRWPKHEDVWRNLGTVEYYLCAAGLDGYSMQRPLSSFLRALAIHPTDSMTLLAMGHCYMYEAKWPEAVGVLERAYNYLPAGAYLVDQISLVRVKLMEALEQAANHVANPASAARYRLEFNRHQAALEKHMAWYVTEENARYLV